VPTTPGTFRNLFVQRPPVAQQLVIGNEDVGIEPENLALQFPIESRHYRDHDTNAQTPKTTPRTESA
jgi:hypothetical protein